MIRVQMEEGKIDFPVDAIDVPCQTYYKIFGDLRCGVAPVVVLHGGPGSGHEYCLPFSKLWSLYGIPVVFYDQIGCAASTHLPQTVGDVSLWQVDLFVAELENLLLRLGLDVADGPGFHVLGHSFGGMVAAAFASRQPPKLHKLVLIGASADGQLFFEGLWQLTKQLSTSAQEAIDEAVRKHVFTDSAYVAAVTEFLKTFLCRADPWPPKELAANFKHQADDPTVRRTMQGPSPWVYDGVLRKYSSIPLLSRIGAPTLVMNGEFDTTQYEPTVPFFNHIQKVHWVTLSNASHMPHLDSAAMQAKILKLVGDFLRSDIDAETS